MPRLVSETFGTGDQSWLGSTHGIYNCRTETLDLTAFVAATHYPNGFIRSGTPLGRITATGLLGPYAGRTNEVQTVSLGAATAGTVTIGFDGETTGAIAFNASTADVQAALLALSNLNQGDVVVTGGPFPGTVTLTFGGAYNGVNVPQVVVTPTGLTGGTVTVTTTTQGGSAVTDGRATLVGFLYTDQRTGGTGRLGVPVFDHGRIKASRLPIPLDDAGKSDVAGRIQFV